MSRQAVRTGRFQAAASLSGQWGDGQRIAEAGAALPTLPCERGWVGSPR